MSRRASNTVKLARLFAARCGVELDRNGIPVLDGPQTNTLAKRCPIGHCTPVKVSDHFGGYGRRGLATGLPLRVIEYRCADCGRRSTETEIVQ